VIEGADYVEEADLVIKALGFEPEDLPTLWGCPELEVTRWGTIKADFRTHETAPAGVYAVGDIVRGASLVVWAIRDGREAAEAILAARPIPRAPTGAPRWIRTAPSTSAFRTRNSAGSGPGACAAAAPIR
jgi:glutamate synthase (NADPH/NADH) small chain